MRWVPRKTIKKILVIGCLNKRSGDLILFVQFNSTTVWNSQHPITWWLFFFKCPKSKKLRVQKRISLLYVFFHIFLFYIFQMIIISAFFIHLYQLHFFNHAIFYSIFIKIHDFFVLVIQLLLSKKSGFKKIFKISPHWF